MRIYQNLALIAVSIVLTCQTAFTADWGSSWLPIDQQQQQSESMLSRRSANADEQTKEIVQGRNYAVHEPILSNDTDINQMIEELLNSRREGRNLGEYDAVYADGNIDQALSQGNDMQARNLIRDKLCGLGLMSCDVEEKRPFYSTIYAQGPPPPGFGGGPYGPAKPMPPPGHFNGRPPMALPPNAINSYGPPRKVGYESVYKPNLRPNGPTFTGPYLEHPPLSAMEGPSGGIFTKPPPGAVIYDSKPPGPIYTGNSDTRPAPPFIYENPEKIQAAGSSFYAPQTSSAATASSSKIVVGTLPTTAGAGLQQHVHHHYHHVEGDQAAGVKVPSVPIPIGSGQTINTDFTSLAQSSATYTPEATNGFTQSSSAFNAGFNSASQGGLLTQTALQGGFGPIAKPNGDIYKPSAGFGSYPSANAASSDFGSSGFGLTSSTAGSYHSQNPDYFKKELHNSNYNGISSGYDEQSAYQNGIYDTSRQQIVDCQCVPINLCPAADRIGRKEDLILPIDPRNLGKDIEALSDDTAANITANTETKTDDADKTAEQKERTRRETNADTAVDKSIDDNTDDLPLDAQGRQASFALPALQAIELIQRKVLPTYGVSFGLPSPSNAYPTNALGDYYPAQNSHFGSIGPNGLNLGLVNVNPLVSVQVSKTDYGEKVVKPLVNLHVTPNANILQTVGNIFKKKPQIIHSSHYHHHDHYSSIEHLDHTPSHYQFSAPGPIKHFDYEMFPSKPIFEYHSGPTYESHPIVEPAHYHDKTYSSMPSLSNALFLGTGPSGFEPHSHLISNYGNDDFAQSSHISNYDDSNFADYNNHYDRSVNLTQFENEIEHDRRGKILNLNNMDIHNIPTQAPGTAEGSAHITFPRDRRRRRSAVTIEHENTAQLKDNKSSRTARAEQRAYYGNRPVEKTCRINEVCCRRPFRPQQASQHQQFGRCGVRNAAGITGRIKNPVYVDGDSEFGEYPWHVAILKKDPKESIYACGGTLIDAQHILSAAHCIKSQNGFDLRVRLGEWDVNHDVEFFPYIERDVVSVHIHPEYYAGTLDNDLAILKLNQPVDFSKNPHISPACLPDKYSDFTNARCWTTGWGKDAFGEHGKYQNILKEVDVPILSHHQCEAQLRNTRLGYNYKLNTGFICAGGEEGKDACKGDGGGPLVCERNGVWNVVGVVSWGIGCGQVNVPGVYVKVSHYLDWIRQITQYYK